MLQPMFQAATAPLWADAVAPYAERVTAVLSGKAVQLPTPLTESNRRDGRKRVHGEDYRAGARSSKQTRDTGNASRTCLECGQILEGRRGSSARMNAALSTAGKYRYRC